MTRQRSRSGSCKITCGPAQRPCASEPPSHHLRRRRSCSALPDGSFKDPSKSGSRFLFDGWWDRAEQIAGLKKVPRLGWHGLRRRFATELKDAPLRDSVPHGRKESINGADLLSAPRCRNHALGAGQSEAVSGRATRRESHSKSRKARKQKPRYGGYT